MHARRCGKYVAAGERGSNPSVHVFEVVTGRCVANLGKAHKYGIASLSFSPDGESRLVRLCCNL